jgi:hypothetical protein
VRQPPVCPNGDAATVNDPSSHRNINLGSRCAGRRLPAAPPRHLVHAKESHVSVGTQLALLWAIRRKFAFVYRGSSLSRVRFAAPNNGAPLTAPCRSQKTLLRRAKGPAPKCRTAGDHFAAIMAPFSGSSAFLVMPHGEREGRASMLGWNVAIPSPPELHVFVH